MLDTTPKKTRTRRPKATPGSVHAACIAEIERLKPEAQQRVIQSLRAYYGMSTIERQLADLGAEITSMWKAINALIERINNRNPNVTLDDPE